MTETRAALVAALAEHDVAVVSGETGSGKTTQARRPVFVACGQLVCVKACASPHRPLEHGQGSGPATVVS